MRTCMDFLVAAILEVVITYAIRMAREARGAKS
jgi:hypothetical protein